MENVLKDKHPTTVAPVGATVHAPKSQVPKEVAGNFEDEKQKNHHFQIF